MRLIKCSPCHGTGIRREYGHVDNGRCWHCLGLGKIERKPRAKRETMADYLARQNAMIAVTFGKD